MEEQDRIDAEIGPETELDVKARIDATSRAGFGIYKNLEDRIKLVMNNFASNTDIYGIDASVVKSNENLDVNSSTTDL